LLLSASLERQVQSHPGTTIELVGIRQAIRLLRRLIGASDWSFCTDLPKHPQNGNPSSSWCCRGSAVSRERSREGSLGRSAGGSACSPLLADSISAAAKRKKTHPRPTLQTLLVSQQIFRDFPLFVICVSLFNLSKRLLIQAISSH